jgi:hypothetical protein
LAIALYKCETQLFILSEAQKLKEFQRGMLRKVFGTISDEVIGKCSKLH